MWNGYKLSEITLPRPLPIRYRMDPVLSIDSGKIEAKVQATMDDNGHWVLAQDHDEEVAKLKERIAFLERADRLLIHDGNEFKARLAEPPKGVKPYPREKD